jgi:hypothetical protein
VRYEVLTADSMKMAVLLVVAPCSLTEVYRRFGGACCQSARAVSCRKLLTADTGVHKTSMGVPSELYLSGSQTSMYVNCVKLLMGKHCKGVLV